MLMNLNLRISTIVYDYHSSDALVFTKLLNKNCKDCN